MRSKRPGVVASAIYLQSSNSGVDIGAIFDNFFALLVMYKPHHVIYFLGANKYQLNSSKL